MAFIIFNDRLQFATYVAGAAPSTPVPGQYYVEVTGGMSVANPENLTTPRLGEFMKITGSGGTVKITLDWEEFRSGATSPVGGIFLSGINVVDGDLGINEFNVNCTVEYVGVVSPYTTADQTIRREEIAVFVDDEFGWYGTKRAIITLSFATDTWDVEIGRAYIGEKYVPQNGFSAGWSKNYKDTGRIKYSSEGDAFPRHGVVYRTISADMQFSSIAGEQSGWENVIEWSGYTRDVLVELRGSYYHGMFERFGQIRHISGDNTTGGFTLRELL